MSSNFYAVCTVLAMLLGFALLDVYEKTLIAPVVLSGVLVPSAVWLTVGFMCLFATLGFGIKMQLATENEIFMKKGKGS